MSFQETAQKIAGAVGTYAPGVAAVLAATGVGAPAAAAVAAIGALAKTFGLPDTASHDDVLAAVTSAASTDPDFKLKMIQADNDFKSKQGDQKIEELKAQLADVQSARQMNVDTTKATGKRDTNLMVMSWLGILVALFVFCVTVYLSIMKVLDPVTATLIGNMTGIFLAKYSTVFDFWMGAGKDHGNPVK